jgi:hypothetical protein
MREILRAIVGGIQNGLNAFGMSYFGIPLLLAAWFAYLPAIVPQESGPPGTHWGFVVFSGIIIGLLLVLLRKLKGYTEGHAATQHLSRARDLASYSAMMLTITFVMLGVACLGLSAILFNLSRAGSSLTPFAAIGRLDAILFVAEQVVSALLFDLLDLFDAHHFPIDARAYPVFGIAVVIFRAAVASLIYGQLVAHYGAYKIKKKQYVHVRLSDGNTGEIFVGDIPEQRRQAVIDAQTAEMEQRIAARRTAN